MNRHVVSAAVVTLCVAAVAMAVVAPQRAGAQGVTKQLMTGNGAATAITSVTQACTTSTSATPPISCNVVIKSSTSTCTLVFHSTAEASAVATAIRDTSGTTTASTVTCMIDGYGGALAADIRIDTALSNQNGRGWLAKY
jgi:hypothetical protein